MRRIEIIKGAKAILEALSISNLDKSIQAHFEKMRGGPEKTKEIPPGLLEALYNYSLMAQNYNETSREMAHILSLSRLTRPTEWQVFSTDVGLLYKMTENLVNTLNFLPKFLKTD